MDTWFEQARYPLVTVNRDYATGQIKITQEIHEDSAKKGNEAWWIPLNFATQSNLDFSSTLATHWLKPLDEDVIIEGVDTNDWIIVNKHLTGKYILICIFVNFFIILNYSVFLTTISKKLLRNRNAL